MVSHCTSFENFVSLFANVNSMFCQSKVLASSSNAALKRRLRTLSRLGKRSANRKSSLDFLPQNESLEQAVALGVYHQQDARSMLSFTKELMGSTLISLASPVGPWDPYDIKPQVFALDTTLGIPVFSSLSHLVSFCQRFQFSVRDPTGRVWTDGLASAVNTLLAQPSKSCDKSEEIDANHLFDLLDAENGHGESLDKVPKKCKKASRKRARTPREDDARVVDAAPLPPDLWEKILAEPRVGISKATPLPMFGPLLRPYFVGYFADVETLLQNASIAPEKADIVLNPTTPLELILGRGATNRVLHRDTLVLHAFHQFEKQVRGEFNRFFETTCPEVSSASSACVAKSHSSELHHNYIDYTVVIIVKSDDMLATFNALLGAKRSNVLRDHPNLEVLPDTESASHARSAATCFYNRKIIEKASQFNEVVNARNVGVMKRSKQSAQLSIGVNADSFFSDPTNFYSEAGFVFADGLRSLQR